MTPEEQDKRDAIRKARIAQAAHPFISEWYEFERNRALAAFRNDTDVVENPVRAIAHQQYLLAIERVALQCLKDIEAGKPEETE